MEQIWKEYHAELHSFIQRRVGDGSIADDILQALNGPLPSLPDNSPRLR